MVLCGRAGWVCVWCVENEPRRTEEVVDMVIEIVQDGTYPADALWWGRGRESGMLLIIAEASRSGKPK